MRNLINFILKNIHWLLFFLFVFLSGVLIVNNNRFQRSKYLAVAKEIAGNIYSVSGNVEAYINLNDKNADLLKRIAELENEVFAYRQRIEMLNDTTGTRQIKIDSLTSLIYTFTPARVVYNNVSGTENYIQLNKGSDDGIEVDMGVISANGIVGVVIAVSAHFSLVIPALNSKYHLSCAVKSNNYSGPLVWDGVDPRYTYLQELPRHVNFELLDTIVTSGNSLIFPEGLPVGRVIDSHKQRNDNYTSLKVELFTNFNTLTDVLIIRNSYKEEQKKLLKTVNL